MKITRIAARAALAAVALAAAAPTMAQTCTSTFDLATAFQADNELCGTPQWELLRSEGPYASCPKGEVCADGVLSPLRTFRTDLANVPGFMGFHGTESCNVHACFPVVLVNTTGAPQMINPPTSPVVVPPGRVMVHPANPENGGNGNAAVGFRSPFTGRARVFIELERADGGLIQWQVVLGKEILQPLTPLPYGSASLDREVSLEKGDLVVLRVDAAGEYGCDSSLLTFRVERL
jgi:hypothetical protein